MPRPVCVRCKIEMASGLNGVMFLQRETNAEVGVLESIALWSCDMFRCSKCGIEILTGFADEPYAHCRDGESFVVALEDIRREGVTLIKEQT